MTTTAGEEHSTQIAAEEDLHDYFHGFAKTRSQMRVGLEAEFFAVDSQSGAALPYEGPGGIQEILKRLAVRHGYDFILDEGSVIGLKRGDSFVALEPGGQVELSAPPVFNAFEVDGQVKKFMAELRSLREDFPRLRWLALGFHPFSKLQEISWVPKRRYRIMADHLKGHGTLSHEMMKRTCTNQINMDYMSEQNAMADLRTSLGITSIVSAIFANSPFTEGRPNGYQTYRVEIWRHTDPERTGLLMEFQRPGRTFKDYLNYTLDIPLIFIVRRGDWIPVKSMTFREFIRKGFAGHRATLGDFELHLSTIFPEARLKQYLEVRGVDCQRPELIPAVAALWKGILYDPITREEAWKLVADSSEVERIQLHADVPKLGLKARLGKRPVLGLARELVDLACRSLAGQKVRDQDCDECHFLKRLQEDVLKPGKSPAEQLLEKWQGELGQDLQRLLKHLSL